MIYTAKEIQNSFLKYFENKVVKSNCVCELKLSENEICIFCNLNLAKSEESKNNNRTLEYINFDHSYTKLPSYSYPNNRNQQNKSKFISNDLDFSPAGNVCSVCEIPASSRADCRVCACNGATVESEMMAAFPVSPLAEI